MLRAVERVPIPILVGVPDSRLRSAPKRRVQLRSRDHGSAVNWPQRHLQTVTWPNMLVLRVLCHRERARCITMPIICPADVSCQEP